jgi:CheY-like chemotaxis protein
MTTASPDYAKILVVDDEKSMREFLEIMLQKEGYNVRCAENGTVALELFKREVFDLVITDIRMRPVDGLEVLKQCKAHFTAHRQSSSFPLTPARKLPWPPCGKEHTITFPNLSKLTRCARSFAMRC